MLDDRELLQVHVETLFTRSASGRLVRVNEPGGDRAPRFFLGRTAHASGCWFRDDVPDDIVCGLEKRCAAIPGGVDEVGKADRAALETVLGAASAVQTVWSGPAFRFRDSIPRSSRGVHITRDNAHVLQPLLHAWFDDVERSQPVYAVLVGGHAVSICASVRRSALADEAGVETAAAYRGMGHAVQAVAAWAAAVVRSGRLPLYSTAWGNAASRGVARRLGLIQYASDLHLT